jgi:hypothetical protein
MALASGESKSGGRKPSEPRLSLDLRFLIAVAGASVSFWLASRQDAHKLPALPTFSERFWLIAPTLLEGVAGIAFLIWVVLLFREAKARSEPKLISGSTAGEAATKKRWAAGKWAGFAVFLLATVLSFGNNYFKYLWPSYPQWISHAAHSVIDVLGVLGIFIESYTRRKKQSPQPGTGFGTERVPWLDEKHKTVILVTLVGIAVLFGIHHAVRNLPPASIVWIMTISMLVLAVIQVTVLRAHRKPELYASQSDIQARSLAPSEAKPSQRKWLGMAVILVICAAIVLVMLSPLPRDFKTATCIAPLGILVIWGAALTKLRRWINGLAKEGEFDRGLQMDRRYALIPGYGTPLEGLILFNAGRYPEARTFLKPFAFDEQGQPRLTSTKLYLYALALENDGLEPEAQKLLEAAIQVPQQRAGFHVALAICLLSQKKEAERARELMELALATTDTQSTAYGRNADYVRRLARYAWALAACGWRPEAEAKLQEAFAGSAALKKRDLAGLQYFAGEAWRSLSEWKRARAAFDEALKLSSDGSAATSTKKALAKMREEAQS